MRKPEDGVSGNSAEVAEASPEWRRGFVLGYEKGLKDAGGESTIRPGQWELVGPRHANGIPRWEYVGEVA